MDSSFMGSEFVVYDSGEDCSRTKMMENYKKQLAYIVYTQDKDQPRKLETLITICDNKSTDFTIIDKKTENVVLDRWKKNNKTALAKLYSK